MRLANAGTAPARRHRLVVPIVRDGQDAVKPGPMGPRLRRQGLDGASPAEARSTKRSMDRCRPAQPPNTLGAVGDISKWHNQRHLYLVDTTTDSGRILDSTRSHEAQPLATRRWGGALCYNR